jgi:hypothetical protein
MKRFFQLMLFIIPLMSCTTDKIIVENSSIIEKWNWIESTGGIAGITQTPQSTGKTIQLEITKTKVIKYINGKFDSELNYTIKSGTSIFGGIRNLIVYENDFRQSFEVTNNHLLLNDECYDCFENKYIRE